MEPSPDAEALATLCPGLPDRVGYLADAALALDLEAASIQLDHLREHLQMILRDEPDAALALHKCFCAIWPLPKCIDRVERKAGGTAVAEPSSRDTDDLLILKALADSPVTMQVQDIATAINRGRKLVGQRLAGLVERRLVYQPQGPRKGYAINKCGRQMTRN